MNVIELTTEDRFGGALRVLDNGREWIMQRHEKDNRRGPLIWADKGYFLHREVMVGEIMRYSKGRKLNAEDSGTLNRLPRVYGR